MDVYVIVTEKIISLLEQGVVPWRRPWTSAGLPRNLVSKKPYRGVNHFLLSASKYVSPFWLTMRQANELGGHVRKGEESTIVVFWKVDDAGETTEDTNNEQPNEKSRRRFLLRYYRVFNLEQCELPQTVLDKLPKIETHEHDPIEAADRIVAAMPKPPEIRHAGSKAFYSSMTDRVTMPPRNLFVSAEEYSATLLHEIDPQQRTSEAACTRGHNRRNCVRFRRLLQRRTHSGDGSSVPLRRSRNLKRRDRESGRVRCRMAQETPRRSKTSGPLGRPGPARGRLHPLQTSPSRISGARRPRLARAPLSQTKASEKARIERCQLTISLCSVSSIDRSTTSHIGSDDFDRGDRIPSSHA